MYPSIWWKSLFKQSFSSCTLHFIETALAKGNFHHELGKNYHLLCLGMGLIFNVNLKGLMGHPLLTSSMFISGPKYASCSQSARSPALNVTVFILRLPWLARFFRLGVEEDLPRRLAIYNTRWFTKSKWVKIHEYRICYGLDQLFCMLLVLLFLISATFIFYVISSKHWMLISTYTQPFV